MRPQSECQIGSGALPETTLAERGRNRHGAVRSRHHANWQTRLRELDTPVIGRIHNGALWLDVRTIDDPDALCAALGGL